MKKDEFRELCQKKLIYLDGATGSNLIKRGMPAGVCPEKWILEHRDVMIGLQREYVAAGTNILYAPTFTANRVKLAEYGLEADIRQINQDLIRISKEAADGKAFVAGDITMTGEQLAPMGSMQFEDLIEIYKEQMAYQLEAGADLFVVETMMIHAPVFYDFYHKKRDEGKAHRVALSHLARKLVRLIYKLETSHTRFDLTNSK